jgi:hypothetical protein
VPNSAYRLFCDGSSSSNSRRGMSAAYRPHTGRGTGYGRVQIICRNKTQSATAHTVYVPALSTTIMQRCIGLPQQQQALLQLT